MLKKSFICLALLLPTLAQAQILLDADQAERGSYYRGVLTVSQGCNGSATTRITVDIPEGLQFAQPMPKAGWQLEIVKKPVERPFFQDGIEITEAVRQISWSGNSLHDIHFDEFVFRGRIGVDASSVLYFPVIQTCESGELHWDQTAEAETATEHQHVNQYAEHSQHQHAEVAAMSTHQHTTSALLYPAPFVKVVDGTGDHHHHH